MRLLRWIVAGFLRGLTALLFRTGTELIHRLLTGNSDAIAARGAGN